MWQLWHLDGKLVSYCNLRIYFGAADLIIPKTQWIYCLDRLKTGWQWREVQRFWGSAWAHEITEHNTAAEIRIGGRGFS